MNLPSRICCGASGNRSTKCDDYPANCQQSAKPCAYSAAASGSPPQPHYARPVLTIGRKYLNSSNQLGPFGVRRPAGTFVEARCPATKRPRRGLPRPSESTAFCRRRLKLVSLGALHLNCAPAQFILRSRRAGSQGCAPACHDVNLAQYFVHRPSSAAGAAQLSRRATPPRPSRNPPHSSRQPTLPAHPPATRSDA
jgi:hypothetical protein